MRRGEIGFEARPHPGPTAVELVRPQTKIFSPPPRETRGERAGERGIPGKTALLSPALSSLGGRRGRRNRFAKQIRTGTVRAPAPSEILAVCGDSAVLQCKDRKEKKICLCGLRVLLRPTSAVAA